jgi:anti-anti-sigma regulatory factor
MELSLWGNLIVGASAPAVVVRFARPDLEDYLRGEVGRCELFQELQEAALGGLGAGESLVLNLGLVESFPRSFVSNLLKVRQDVQAYRGRLILCGLRPGFREMLAPPRMSPLFEITPTEAEAIRRATG